MGRGGGVVGGGVGGKGSLEEGQVSRNKQIYLPAPLSDYFAPVFCSRPYETQMSSEARASYRALSITSLCAPEALTPDYWLRHKGCFLPPAAAPQMIQQTSLLFFFSFLKRNFIWQLMRPEIVVERIFRKDGAVGWMCVCVCTYREGLRWQGD